MDNERLAKDLLRLAKEIVGSGMDFEDWAEHLGTDADSLKGDDAADLVKQFGFDYASGENDAKDVDLRTVAEYIEEHSDAWEEIDAEVGKILIKDLMDYLSEGAKEVIKPR